MWHKKLPLEKNQNP